MADSNKVGIALAGACIAGLAALLLSRGASAAEPGAPAPEGMDEETWRLVQAIGEGIVEESQKLDAMVNAINNLTISMGGQVSVANSRTTTQGQVTCPVIGRGVQLPSRVIPWNRQVVIKALPTNVGVISVSETQQSVGSAWSRWPLIANEGIGYFIAKLDAIWISATVAGEGIAFTVEQD